MKRNVLLIIIIIVTCNINVNAIRNDSLLTEQLMQIQDNFSIIGFSVVVTNQNRIIYSNQFGFSDVSRQIPVTHDTKYRIASISKLFTATALMKLYEQELVDLDIDISRYLGYDVVNPNYPNVSITLRQLMTHTSSLRDADVYFDFLGDSYGNNNPPALQELLVVGGSYYQNNIWSSSFEPGNSEGWDYCNLGSGVVATIVENITGMNFNDYCQNNIFRPLEMDACLNDLENLSDINQLSVLYRYNNSGDPVPQLDNHQGEMPDIIDWSLIQPGLNGLIHGPQGSVRCSAFDLAKFLISYMNYGLYNDTRLLDEETVEEMFLLNWEGYGLGGFFRKMGLQFQITNDIYDYEMLGHAGEAYGLLSDMYFNIDNDLGIIVIMNGADYGYGENVFYDVEEAIFNAVNDYMIYTENYDENENQYKEEKFKIFPNVITNNTTIHLDILSPISDFNIDIFNVKGQRVNKINVDNCKQKIALVDNEGRNLVSGIYFLRGNLNNKQVVKKIVIIE